MPDTGVSKKAVGIVSVAVHLWNGHSSLTARPGAAESRGRHSEPEQDRSV